MIRILHILIYYYFSLLRKDKYVTCTRVSAFNHTQSCPTGVIGEDAKPDFTMGDEVTFLDSFNVSFSCQI